MSRKLSLFLFVLEKPLISNIIFYEVPGCILQVFAALILLKDGNDVPIGSQISIIVSALTTGLTSATISYDFDVDPAKREHSPRFYG